MRIAAEPTEQETIEGAASGILSDREWERAGRTGVLQTELPTKALAQKYLLANWPVVEKMAREALAAGI